MGVMTMAMSMTKKNPAAVADDALKFARKQASSTGYYRLTVGQVANDIHNHFGLTPEVAKQIAIKAFTG